MVYTLEIMEDDINNEPYNSLWVNSDKHPSTWSIEMFPHLEYKECEDGLSMVKRGVKQFMESDNLVHLMFQHDECGCGGYRNEWILLALALLKDNGYISLDKKAVFTVMRSRWKQECNGVKDVMMDCCLNVLIAREGETVCYELDISDVLAISRINVETITLRAQEKRARKRMGNRLDHSYMVMRMDVVDFGSMFAHRDMFTDDASIFTDNGRDILGQVEAVLMGTHQRLGEKSHLHGLDVGVIAMIVRGVLPMGIREAVDAGVLRL